MNKKQQEKIINYVDKNAGINVEFDNCKTFIINDYSSYGEDIYEVYNFNDFDDLLEQLKDHFEGFDSGEYFKLWYGANKGEPQEPQDLLDAAEEHKNIIKQVYEALFNYSQLTEV